MNFIHKKMFSSLMLLLLVMSTAVLGIAVYNPKDYILPESDMIVVFGAGYHKDGTPAPALEKRLDKAAAIWDGQSKIVVSGREDETKIMEDYLKSNNIPEENIIVDIYGVKTLDTVKNSLRLAESMDTKAVFISQAYHLPRIRLYTSAYGDAGFVPTERVNISWYNMLYTSARELGAIMVFPFLYIQDNSI